jgi:hypothetical protein
VTKRNLVETELKDNLFVLADFQKSTAFFLSSKGIIRFCFFIGLEGMLSDCEDPVGHSSLSSLSSLSYSNEMVSGSGSHSSISKL